MVRELSDKYAVVVYVYYNTGILDTLITVRVIISEQPMSDLCSFEISKVKSIKTGPSFVGRMRLVTGLSEGNEKYSLASMEQVIISMHSHDQWPILRIHSLCFIVGCFMHYFYTSCFYTSYSYSYFALLKTPINKCSYEPAYY